MSWQLYYALVFLFGAIVGGVVAGLSEQNYLALHPDAWLCTQTYDAGNKAIRCTQYTKKEW